jgi:hypothetical protein
MPIHLYMRDPIDLWLGWMTEAEFRAAVERRFPTKKQFDVMWAGYTRMWHGAQAMAKRFGWPGDIREGPYVSGIPGPEIEDDGLILIGWKENQSGFTYIASPFPLPWLDAMAIRQEVNPKASTRLPRPASAPKPAPAKKPRR